MPAQSKAQQKAAGAALSAKRGETPKSELQGAAKEMAETMTEAELEDLAETPRKDLPEKKDGQDMAAEAWSASGAGLFSRLA